MASTAHKTEEEKQQYFDSPEVLDEKITKLAEMVQVSKHFIAFTGAGISTSAGVPDYRSGQDTILPTGPGCWEKMATNPKSDKQPVRTAMLKAVPTSTHMSLVALQQKGLLKFLISQNIDGLHRRSGFAPEKLCEVHGNTNLEFCQRCGQQYLRDFRVRTAQKVHDHATGRKCKCGGDLHDSIINFGENLPEKAINDGFQQSEKADLCLAMGSSLRVTPAANMPETVGKNKQNLVIVNLQKTPLDSQAVMCIHALCDTVMEKLMVKLGLEIPPFVLKRFIQVTKSKGKITAEGVDVDGIPFSLFKDVKVTFGNLNSTLTKEPFAYTLPQDVTKGNIEMNLGFQGNYGEPNYKIQFAVEKISEGDGFTLSIAFNTLLKGDWKMVE